MAFEKTRHAPKTLKSGTELPLLDLKGKPYLQVAHRLVWVREEHPLWCISASLISSGENWFIFKAIIADESGKVIATAHKRECTENFPDAVEKAETGAIGRALAIAGYGTQFEPEFDEQERLADSPIEPAKKGPLNVPKVEPKVGAGNSLSDQASKSGGVLAVKINPPTPAPLGELPKPQAGPTQVNATAKAKTRQDLNNLISSLARSVIAKRIYSLESLKDYLRMTYKAEDKASLTEGQAQELLQYLEKVNNLGALEESPTAQRM